MGRRGKGPKDSFKDTNCGIVLIIKLSKIPKLVLGMPVATVQYH